MRIRAWWLGLGLVLALGCGSAPGESAVITSTDQASDLLLEAQEIARPLAQKFERGDEIFALELESLKKAKANFESLVAYDPDNAQYAFGLGKVQRMLGETELAYQQFDNIRNRFGDPAKLDRQAKLIYGESTYELASMLREKNEHARSLELAKLADKITPDQPRYLGLIAIESAQAKDYKAAREYAKRAQKLDPNERNARAALMLLPE